MTFTTELTIDDHKDFLRLCGPQRGLRTLLVAVCLLVLIIGPFLVQSVVLFAVSLSELWRQDRLLLLMENPILLGLVMFGLLLLPVAYLWLRWMARFLSRTLWVAKADGIDESSLREGFNLGPIEFEALPDGLRIAMPLDEERYRWSAFQEVRETENTLFLMFDERSGAILPKRAFAEERACVEFKSLAERNIGSII